MTKTTIIKFAMLLGCVLSFPIYAPAAEENCKTDRVYSSEEYMRRHENGAVINCLNLFDPINRANEQAYKCASKICEGFQAPNPSDWIVMGPDRQLLDCRALEHYKEPDGSTPSWWAQYCGSYTPRAIDTNPGTLEFYPISKYPPVNGNCNAMVWIILSYTGNAVPWSNEDPDTKNLNLQDCRGMYANGMTRDRLKMGGARIGISDPEGMSGSITNQQWYDRYTNTGKNDNTSCTTWDVAFDNCNPRTNKRYFEYDSSNADFMENWDQIVYDATKSKTISAKKVLLLNEKIAAGAPNAKPNQNNPSNNANQNAHRGRPANVNRNINQPGMNNLSGTDTTSSPASDDSTTIFKK